jgi:hypothetical protein
MYREADLAAVEGTVPGGARYPAVATAHLDGEKGVRGLSSRRCKRRD